MVFPLLTYCLLHLKYALRKTLLKKKLGEKVEKANENNGLYIILVVNIENIFNNMVDLLIFFVRS